MKLCIAQTNPFKGNIEKNIEAHIKFINKASSLGAKMILFPELSLTGYEPELSKDLATDKDDARFDSLQNISNDKNIIVCAGMPIKNNDGTTISMIVFQPNSERLVYSKKYIHPDEEEYFVSGENIEPFIGKKIALSICYELSIPEHSEFANKSGAEIYISSSAKKAAGVERAVKSRTEISKKYSMIVLFSNCIGDNECVGNSFAMNKEGKIVERLDNENEGMIIYDTITSETSKFYF